MTNPAAANDLDITTSDEGETSPTDTPSTGGTGPNSVKAGGRLQSPRTRRQALTVVGFGLVAAACRNTSEERADGSPSAASGSAEDAGGGLNGGEAASANENERSTGTAPLVVQTDGSGDNNAVAPIPEDLPPTATGPELDQLVMPTPPNTPAPGPAPSGQTPSGQAAPNTTPGSTPGQSTPSSTTAPSSNGSPSSSQAPSSTATTNPPATDPTNPPSNDSSPSTTSPPPTTEDQPLNIVPVAAGPVLLANRVTFGTTPEVQAEINRLGPDGFVADQLTKTGPDRQIENRLNNYNLLRVEANKAGYDRVRAAKMGPYQMQLTNAALMRAVHSNHQVYEMMCQLWMDHFNVDLMDDGAARHLLAPYQERVIRPNAMGSFRDLLVATAHSTAMLYYLDNETSNANANEGINENYGRELLELHTLGIDENGNHIYTEADVRAASLAMTGWSMERRRQNANYTRFLFRDNYHYTGNISLLGGAWTRGGTQGKATGDSLLQFLATHPATARHIARKLCIRFVSDRPSAALIDSAAQVYLANDTQLVPTLRHILTSDEFAASAGQKLRRPLELVSASMRALGASVPGGFNSDGARQLRNALTNMDHLPWGWAQPDGFPDNANHWLTTDGLSSRWQLVARLANGRVSGISVDLPALQRAAGGSNLGEMINGLAQRFGIGPLPEAQVQAVAAAANLSPGDGAGQANGNQLAQMVGLLLSHPIFQTR